MLTYLFSLLNIEYCATGTIIEFVDNSTPQKSTTNNTNIKVAKNNGENNGWLYDHSFSANKSSNYYIQPIAILSAEDLK